MIIKKRLKNIKENVYMRSEIAKISKIGIDTSLKEELELIEEIDRLNNIINDIEEYTTENIEVLENRLNSPFCNFEKVTKELLIFQNYLDKLKELKENK